MVLMVFWAGSFLLVKSEDGGTDPTDPPGPVLPPDGGGGRDCGPMTTNPCGPGSSYKYSTFEGFRCSTAEEKLRSGYICTSVMVEREGESDIGSECMTWAVDEYGCQICVKWICEISNGFPPPIDGIGIGKTPYRCTNNVCNCEFEDKMLFPEGSKQYGVCTDDYDWCVSQCKEEGDKDDNDETIAHECNPNLFDPDYPEREMPGEIPTRCRTFDLTNPMCLIDRSCWMEPQKCITECDGRWYCDPVTGGCRYGFFWRNGGVENNCVNRTGSPGCFQDLGTCEAACECTPKCLETYCDGEEIPDGCGGLCPTTECNIELVQPPGLGVGVGVGLTIMPDESGRNHICEMDASGEERFFVSNTVRFSFVLDGWSEDESKMGVVGIGFNNNDDDNVLTMTMALFGGSPSEAFPPTGTSAGYVLGTAGTRLLPEIGREFFFDITFLDGFDDNLNFAWVSAVTGNGTTLPWTFTGRSFKVWDCKVPVSGAMYDGTVEEGGDVCIDGFSEKVEADFYDSLTFRRLGNNPEDFEMTVNSPDYESDGNSLDWGFSYNHLFGNLDGDSENILLKVTDVGGSSSCDALLNLGTRVDPYSTLPSAVVDFALAVNPDPWFQSIDGGVQAGGNFTNTVPVTCASNPDCVEASVISGLLAAGGSMNKGCSDCSFASPDTWVNKNMVTGSFAYQYFYNEYFAKLGQGTTMSGESTMTDLGEEAKGIYFIDGDFFVDKNNTLTTASSDYLIIIAKGRIIFEEDVDVSSGIFIADGDIEARGEGSSNLTIEGMLFSTNGNVRLSRGYINRSMNRSNPGVLVLFRPDYLFKLPGEITRVLSGWRER